MQTSDRQIDTLIQKNDSDMQDSKTNPKNAEDVSVFDKKRLRGYQVMTFILTFLNYASLHTTRSMWSSATKDIEKLYGFTTKQIAMVDMWFLLAYSIGGIFLCQIADKYEKRRIIVLQYTIVAAITSCLGLCMFIPK